MAVSRKAMTEGIRTPVFLSTSNKTRFDNPSVSCADSSLYTREPLVLSLISASMYSQTPRKFRIISLLGILRTSRP